MWTQSVDEMQSFLYNGGSRLNGDVVKSTFWLVLIVQWESATLTGERSLVRAQSES